MAKTKTITVKLVVSPIGTPRNQREIVRGLGLRKLHSQAQLVDNPSVRGAIFKVSHLVQVVGE